MSGGCFVHAEKHVCSIDIRSWFRLRLFVAREREFAESSTCPRKMNRLFVYLQVRRLLLQSMAKDGSTTLLTTLLSRVMERGDLGLFEAAVECLLVVPKVRNASYTLVDF